jgi:hypothetical protein
MRPTYRLLTLAANLRLSIPDQSVRRADLYRCLGATSPEVIKLTGLASNPFGYQAEHILINRLGLKPRLHSEHDAICPSTGSRIEIKCARFALTSTPGNLIYTWTRIHPARAKFDILLLGLLDLHGFRVWELSRQTAWELISAGSQMQQSNTSIRHYQLLTQEKIKVLL